MNVPKLLRLSKSGLTLSATAEDVRGFIVVCELGKEIGHVEDLLIDDTQKLACAFSALPTAVASSASASTTFSSPSMPSRAFIETTYTYPAAANISPARRFTIRN